jgi:hypothetical protein
MFNLQEKYPSGDTVPLKRIINKKFRLRSMKTVPIQKIVSKASSKFPSRLSFSRTGGFFLPGFPSLALVDFQNHRRLSEQF